MRKKYMSLVELLCILGIAVVTGGMSTKLFFGFMKENASLEKHQQSHRDFKNIIRACREWAITSDLGLVEVENSILSGENEINIVDGKVVFKKGVNESSFTIPKGFTLNLNSELDPAGEALLVIRGERRGLSYCLKLPLGVNIHAKK